MTADSIGQPDESEFQEIYAFGMQYQMPAGWGARELSDVALRVINCYRQDGRCLGTLSDLRATLFYALRAWRHEGSFMPSTDPRMPMFRDLVDTIKRLSQSE